MKRFINYIRITFAALGLAWLVWPAAALAVTDLQVNFQNTPLFSEAAFTPGQSVTRWVKVTNNSASSQTIAVDTSNRSDPDGLAAQLDLVITEGAATRFTGTLKSFFTAGETALSSLAGGGTMTEYDFTITFKSGAGNGFQGKTVGFDLLVGFQGTEQQESDNSDSVTVFGSVSTGGGGSISCAVSDASVQAASITNNSAVIQWTTSLAASSRVIYAGDGESYAFVLVPPDYGYPHAVADDTGVTGHSLTLTGLDPDTTYHYRVVSCEPAAVSFEHVFTTLPGGTVAGEQTGTGGGTPTPSPSPTPTVAGGQVAGVSQTGGGQTETGSGTPGEETGSVLGETVAQNGGEVKPNVKNLLPCAPSPWWPVGYLVYALLLAGAYLLALRGWKIAVWWLAPLIILMAGLLWWWFEPCGLRLWYWPAMTVLIFAAASIWYIVAVSPQDRPPQDGQQLPMQ